MQARQFITSRLIRFDQIPKLSQETLALISNKKQFSKQIIIDSDYPTFKGEIASEIYTCLGPDLIEDLAKQA